MIERFLKILCDNHLTEPDLIERYLLAGFFITQYFKDKSPSILDVGGHVNTSGGEQILPVPELFEHGVALDIEHFHQRGKYIRGNGLDLPFKSKRFDMVLSLDVLEHIASDDRERFLKELFRVSKDAVFISFPFDDALNRKVDAAMYQYVKDKCFVDFKELKEHIQFKLPKVDDIYHILKNISYVRELWGEKGGSIFNFLHHFFLRYNFYSQRDVKKLRKLEGFFFKCYYRKSLRVAPFYRQFFIGSMRNDPDFKSKMDNIFDNFSSHLNLNNGCIDTGGMDQILEHFNYIFNDGRSSEKIAVFVLYEEEQTKENVAEVLNHITTQILENQVCEIFLFYHHEEQVAYLKKKYPQIHFERMRVEDRHLIPQKMLGMSKADHFYLISGNNMTFTHSLNVFHSLLKNKERYFIKFTFNRRESLYDPYITDKLFLFNCFFKREILKYLEGFNGDSFQLRFHKKLKGYRFNDYNIYFHLITGIKKILFATHLYYPSVGGAENWMRQVAEILVGKDHKVKVLTSQGYSTEAFFLKDKRRIERLRDTINGVEIERFGFRRFGRAFLNLLRNIACKFEYPLGNFIRIYSFGPRNRGIYRRILEENPDLIIANPMPMMNIVYAFRAAKKLNKPFICVPSFHIEDRCGYHNDIFYRIMRESDLVVAQTTTEGQFFCRVAGVGREKILLLPPAIEIDSQREVDKAELKDKLHIKEKTVVLHLGTHGEHKNILSVIRAMKYVSKKRDDIALVVAGGMTDFTRVLKDEAERLRISCNAKIYFFDDFQEELKGDLYAVSDIFIMLSRFESFGIVVIEAMEKGLPVIADLKSIVRKIVDDLENGILVDSGNISEISGAILELAEDEKLRDRYGENARAKIAKYYDYEKIKKKWKGVVNYVLNRSKGKIS